MQSIALSARQNAGISSAAREKTGLSSTQNVTGHSRFDSSSLKVMVDGYLLSPSSELISVWVIIPVITVVVVIAVIVVALEFVPRILR